MWWYALYLDRRESAACCQYISHAPALSGHVPALMSPRPAPMPLHSLTPCPHALLLATPFGRSFSRSVGRYVSKLI